MAERRKSKKSPAKPSTEIKDDLEISEDEQWRLIEQSGILKRMSEAYPDARPPNVSVQSAKPSKTQNDDEDEEVFGPLADEIFAAVTIIMPLSFLLLLMYILVHFQYAQRPDYWEIAKTMATSVPILSGFVFYTNRHKADKTVQLVLFLMSIVVGIRMVHHVNYANWRVNMRETPPLGTIWVYTIVQLELGPAVLGLCAVAAWTWWSGMRIIFD
ncbi:hypothetical protein OF83DRAFT_1050570 [Amylostereum chailletii]|nr:hypothetical protein OF83DRAFT_1050570 [Amylostereum chailletii]